MFLYLKIFQLLLIFLQNTFFFDTKYLDLKLGFFLLYVPSTWHFFFIKNFDKFNPLKLFEPAIKTYFKLLFFITLHYIMTDYINVKILYLKKNFNWSAYLTYL